MKNLIMIAIALVTINATAQDRKKDASKREMKQQMEMRQDMTPEETAKLQTKKMTLHLDLTEQQQVEVEKVLLVEAKTRKTKMETFKTKNNQADVVKISNEERLKMKNERLDHQIEIKKQMKSILNADQYEKFEKMQDDRKTRQSRKSKMTLHNN